MIITRSPLRVALGGGGTDLPSYYREHEGFVLAAAIDRYVYITLHHTFEQELIVKYSRMERVATADEVQHPIVREALRMMEIDAPHLEITSMADIPAGTGLGSSGSFTTALLKALSTFRLTPLHPDELARRACEIEIERLREPVGKQDQYIAAYGGVSGFRFSTDDRVHVTPLRLRTETLDDLEDNLLLFFTGFSRSASALLRDQDTRTRQGDGAMTGALHLVKRLGLASADALAAGDLRTFAELMNEHWSRKRQRSAGMSNAQIDDWYALARRNGALGGKLVGAGGGGFLMFYAEDRVRLRQALREAGLREVRFRFDFEGTKVVSQP